MRFIPMALAAITFFLIVIGARAQPAPVLVTFNDMANPGRSISGEQYPTGLITWGTNWYLSSPWGQFNTNSVSTSSASTTSASLSFMVPSQVLEFDAYNGGGVSSAITLSCNGQVSRTVPAGSVLHVVTGLTGTCGSVTITSSNGWNTNFDNILVAPSSSQPTPTPTSTSTPVPGGSTMGDWSNTADLPMVPVALAVLSDGRLLIADEGHQPAVFNPMTLGYITASLADDLFCTAFVGLADGRVMAVGGHGGGQSGIRDANIFNPATNTWTQAASMTDPRWYPTATRLGDGRILALSGALQDGFAWADTPEVYDPTTNT